MTRPDPLPGSHDRDEPARRLFFALWPDRELIESLRHRLPGLLKAVKGRILTPPQWHVTLEFLGNVAESRLDELRSMAGALQGETIDLSFDRLEHWRRPRLICLSASVTPRALAGLVGDLRKTLRDSDFRVDERDYKPHLTLARNVRRAPPRASIDPLAWHADSFALVESVTDRAGAVYRPLAQWPLKSDGAAA